jgi:hypothetical protein
VHLLEQAVALDEAGLAFEDPIKPGAQFAPPA